MTWSPYRAPESILVVRRDNIGDVVCTTPLIHALREAYPKACIEAFVSDYTRAVLVGNPDLDAVHSYRKSKHAKGWLRPAMEIAARVSQIRALRSRHYDLGIIAAPRFEPRAARFMRWIRPRAVVGFTDRETPTSDITLAVEGIDPGDLHHCEHLFRLLKPLGLQGAVPGLAPIPSAGRVPDRSRVVVGVHISARKPPNRWPAERFTSLLRELCAMKGVIVLLLWAPGDRNNPTHPGDDEKAGLIIRAFPRGEVEPVATHTLEDLIAALGRTDLVICSDGGAMHIAAALRKPIVCLFGRSLATHWHPWRVPYRLLQPPSRRVEDIGPDEVLGAVGSLAGECGIQILS
jgi:heptosyltransferase-3